MRARSTGCNEMPVAQSFCGPESPVGGPGSPQLGADRLPSLDRPERLPLLQHDIHDIDGRQHRSRDGDASDVVPVFPRDATIERAKLWGPIDRASVSQR